MKMYVRQFIAAALFFTLSGAALAQWQVPDNNVPIGRGGAVQGFKFAAPGANNTALFSTGTASLPAFRRPSFTDLVGNIAISQMNSGTGASASTFWRGDGTWSVATGTTSFFETKTVAAATSVPASVNYIVTAGYSTVGDDGGAAYVRTGAGPATVYRFQTADGSWWVLNSRTVTPAMFSCRGNGTTDDTACWQAVAAYLNAQAPTAVTINNTPGAVYKIWPAGFVPSNLMTLTGVNGLVWNWNGSRFQTDNLFAVVGIVRAVTFRNSSNIVLNDPSYVRTSWAGTLTLNDATFINVVDAAVPWSKNIVVNNLTMNGGAAAFICSFDGSPFTGGYASGVQLNNMNITNVYYGANFQGNCDNVVATIKGSNTTRLYFPWNVANHKAMLEGDGGATNEHVLLSTIAMPAAPEDKRGLFNVDVTYLNRGRVNSTPSSPLTHVSMNQFVAPLTVSGAANNGSGKVRLTVNSTADVTSGRTWFFGNIGGTTEANGKQTVTVVDATHLDLPDVNFVNAYTSGGYGKVPASVRNLKIRTDVTVTSNGQAGMLSWSKYNSDGTPNTLPSGYVIDNFQFSGSGRGYTSGTIFEFLTGTASVGDWTGETIKNASIRDLVLTGSGTAALSAPSGTTLYVENVYADNTINWTLGGTLSNYRFRNVYANGITNQNAVRPSAAPTNQFATGIDQNGLISYAQPAISGISGLGAGCATWLGTPSSANLRGCLTDETGTGLVYFQDGALGTPSSGTLTNATGLPVSSGLAGLGTGIATALAVNVGTAGAPVINGGALGSPSSAGTMPAFTLGGAVTGGGQNITGLGAIGGTSLSVSGNISSTGGLLSINGIGAFGAGGTGSTISQVFLDGGSGANGGCQFAFRKNSLTVLFFGCESGIVGGGSTSNNFLLQMFGGFGSALRVDHATGVLSSLSTTAATSVSTGGIVGSGGLGIAGAGWFGTYIATGVVAVASLPACGAGIKGARMFVNNATATTFASTVAGGGANNVPVVCDGTNWIIGANDNVPIFDRRKFA